MHSWHRLQQQQQQAVSGSSSSSSSTMRVMWRVPGGQMQGRNKIKADPLLLLLLLLL
jgi:hypothetical protein